MSRLLSSEAKVGIVKKVLLKDGRTAKEIAKEHNIGYSTLSRWVRQCRNGELHDRSKQETRGQKLSSSSRFEHLMATSALDEAGIGRYCREHGIYSFQLTQWKEKFMKEESREKQQACFSELRNLRSENKQLKKEAIRKDRALAEASALLVLKKKAALIWGESEDG